MGFLPFFNATRSVSEAVRVAGSLLFLIPFWTFRS